MLGLGSGITTRTFSPQPIEAVTGQGRLRYRKLKCVLLDITRTRESDKQRVRFAYRLVTILAADPSSLHPHIPVLVSHCS